MSGLSGPASFAFRITLIYHVVRPDEVVIATCSIGQWLRAHTQPIDFPFPSLVPCAVLSVLLIYLESQYFSVVVGDAWVGAIEGL